MSANTLFAAPVGLLPVLLFLLVLLMLDSYKLLRLRTVLWVIGTGALVAAACYWINASLLDVLHMSLREYAQFVSPFVEEACKALVVIFLIRINRIGFLVDAAILGFAVGAGFALAENFFYLATLPDAQLGVWIVRGFGTAIMHGGATAIFAVMSQALTERTIGINPLMLIPGYAIAVAIHALFNHMIFISPVLSAAVVLLVVPLIFQLVYAKNSKAMHQWLQLDFDADADLIEQINSNQFSETPIGRYLSELQAKFSGPVVVDMLCYLRLYTELALRAKGLLMMRENGIDLPVGDRTDSKFEEMRYLEKSIGRTGRLAMKPFLHMTRKDLWQLNVLDD